VRRAASRPARIELLPIGPVEGALNFTGREFTIPLVLPATEIFEILVFA